MHRIPSTEVPRCADPRTILPVGASSRAGLVVGKSSWPRNQPALEVDNLDPAPSPPFPPFAAQANFASIPPNHALQPRRRVRIDLFGISGAPIDPWRQTNLLDVRGLDLVGMFLSRDASSAYRVSGGPSTWNRRSSSHADCRPRGALGLGDERLHFRRPQRPEQRAQALVPALLVTRSQISRSPLEPFRRSCSYCSPSSYGSRARVKRTTT